MAFSLSPAVDIREFDLTTTTPAVATSIGALVGDFKWGPVHDVRQVSNEDVLRRIYGEPNKRVAKDWFSASNFLGYSNNLKIIRSVVEAEKDTAFSPIEYSDNNLTNSAAFNAFLSNSLLGSPAAKAFVKNSDHLENEAFDILSDNGHSVIAKWPGSYPNPSVGNIEVSMRSGKNWETYDIVTYDDTNDEIEIDRKLDHIVREGSRIVIDGSTYNVKSVSYNDPTTTITVEENLPATTSPLPDRVQIIDGSDFKYADEFQNPPQYDEDTGFDEYAIVITETGVVSETFVVSDNPDAKDFTGKSVYADDVINRQSSYIWTIGENLFHSNHESDFEDKELDGGSDGDRLGPAEYIAGWDIFAVPDNIDINLLITGGADQVSAKWVLQNVSHTRLDCVTFISPQQISVVGSRTPADDVVSDRFYYPSSSYGFFDGNYKYQYDRFNDTFHWIPLNADIAGLAARTDNDREAWYSPAGYNRGFIKNAVKLAFNPSKANRDKLYKNNVNPVITEKGQGTLLFGDKTMQTQPSAFDRINVRRLFIVLEKAISTAAKYQLFEFNDEITRRQFINSIVPFLRNIENRRGIDNYKVVADESNNTPYVIQNNQFVADIYIVPRYSINFIRLNFVAVSPGVDFEEVVGSF